MSLILLQEREFSGTLFDMKRKLHDVQGKRVDLGVGLDVDPVAGNHAAGSFSFWSLRANSHQESLGNADRSSGSRTIEPTGREGGQTAQSVDTELITAFLSAL